MTREELQSKAGMACEFRWSCPVVPLELALEAIETNRKAERDACVSRVINAFDEVSMSVITESQAMRRAVGAVRSLDVPFKIND